MNIDRDQLSEWKARAEKAEAALDAKSWAHNDATKDQARYYCLKAQAAEKQLSESRAEAARLRAAIQTTWDEDQDPHAETWHKLWSVAALRFKDVLAPPSGREALDSIRAVREDIERIKVRANAQPVRVEEVMASDLRIIAEEAERALAALDKAGLK